MAGSFKASSFEPVPIQPLTIHHPKEEEDLIEEEGELSGVETSAEGDGSPEKQAKKQQRTENEEREAGRLIEEEEAMIGKVNWKVRNLQRSIPPQNKISYKA